MTSLQTLTDEQLDQDIEWAKEHLYFMDVEERTAAFYIRQRALENFIRRFEQEQQRRIRRQELAERLGPLSLESQDPAQLDMFRVGSCTRTIDNQLDQFSRQQA